MSVSEACGTGHEPAADCSVETRYQTWRWSNSHPVLWLGSRHEPDCVTDLDLGVPGNISRAKPGLHVTWPGADRSNNGSCKPFNQVVIFVFVFSVTTNNCHSGQVRSGRFKGQVLWPGSKSTSERKDAAAVTYVQRVRGRLGRHRSWGREWHFRRWYLVNRRRHLDLDELETTCIIIMTMKWSTTSPSKRRSPQLHGYTHNDTHSDQTIPRTTQRTV